MIQIDIDMPKGCAYCPISDVQLDFGDLVLLCHINPECCDVTEYEEKRPKGCPLKEVKEET